MADAVRNSNGYDLRTFSDREIRSCSSSFSVQLIVKDNPAVTFKFLKGLQDLGCANEDSTIVLNNVCVPAGYCRSYSSFLSTYNAISTGDRGLVYDLVPDDVSNHDAIQFIAACSSSMSARGFDAFTADEVHNFFQYRASKNSTGSRK